MSLIIPDTARPSNLHMAPSTQVRMVESDLYDICRRIRAIDPNLFVVELQNDTQHAYAIMESCRDGVERLIFKVEVLDARVLRRLEEIMHKPLAARMAQLERDEHRLKEEQAEADFDDLYERLGRPMWTQLEHDGFIQRGVSYPKRGVAVGTG